MVEVVMMVMRRRLVVAVLFVSLFVLLLQNISSAFQMER